MALLQTVILPIEIKLELFEDEKNRGAPSNPSYYKYVIHVDKGYDMIAFDEHFNYSDLERKHFKRIFLDSLYGQCEQIVVREMANLTKTMIEIEKNKEVK